MPPRRDFEFDLHSGRRVLQGRPDMGRPDGKVGADQVPQVEVCLLLVGTPADALAVQHLEHHEAEHQLHAEQVFLIEDRSVFLVKQLLALRASLLAGSNWLRITW